MFYYNDLEVANPLGSKRTKHKLGMYNHHYVHKTHCNTFTLLYRVLLLSVWKSPAKV